jgi:hypothetical protein
MVIRKKADVENFISDFQAFSEWDGTKHYISLEDPKNNGYITVISYPNGKFTFHRKNNSFWDLREHPINGEEIISLLWKNRKALNPLIRSR